MSLRVRVPLIRFFKSFQFLFLPLLIDVFAAITLTPDDIALNDGEDVDAAVDRVLQKMMADTETEKHNRLHKKEENEMEMEKKMKELKRNSIEKFQNMEDNMVKKYSMKGRHGVGSERDLMKTLASGGFNAGSKSHDDTEDSEYYREYENANIHKTMIQDTSRMESYYKAITEGISLKDKIVVDFGCGSGVLSMLAVKDGGAKLVYCVEKSKIRRRTTRILRRNGMLMEKETYEGRWGSDLKSAKNMDGEDEEDDSTNGSSLKKEEEKELDNLDSDDEINLVESDLDSDSNDTNSTAESETPKNKPTGPPIVSLPSNERLLSLSKNPKTKNARIIIVQDINQVPESVADVLLSEWMGYLLLTEDMIGDYINARDRVLNFNHPDGTEPIMIPSEAKIYIQPVSDPVWWRNNVDWIREDKNKYGLDFSELYYDSELEEVDGKVREIMGKDLILDSDTDNDDINVEEKVQDLITNTIKKTSSSSSSITSSSPLSDPRPPPQHLLDPKPIRFSHWGALPSQKLLGKRKVACKIDLETVIYDRDWGCGSVLPHTKGNNVNNKETNDKNLAHRRKNRLIWENIPDNFHGFLLTWEVKLFGDYYMSTTIGQKNINGVKEINESGANQHTHWGHIFWPRPAYEMKRNLVGKSLGKSKDIKKDSDSSNSNVPTVTHLYHPLPIGNGMDKQQLSVNLSIKRSGSAFHDFRLSYQYGGGSSSSGSGSGDTIDLVARQLAAEDLEEDRTHLPKLYNAILGGSSGGRGGSQKGNTNSKAKSKSEL